MSLVNEIQRVHDFLFKEVGDTKLLLPIMLTILDKFKEKRRAGIHDPMAALKDEFRGLDRRSMEQTLQKVRRDHSMLSPLLERLIEDALNTIRPERLPDAKIERVKERIVKAESFLKGLEKEDDFIGILFETLAAHSGVKENHFLMNIYMSYEKA